MKQLKYFAMAALVAAFASCSDDEVTMNSSADVTVEFETAAVSYNENYGIVEVPLKVTGELNGAVKATFSVEPLQGAVENEHYVVTTNQILIPSSLDGTFACELHLLDDGITENDDRAVRITLENVEGATVGANASCMVTIADVDNFRYNTFFTQCLRYFRKRGKRIPVTVWASVYQQHFQSVVFICSFHNRKAISPSGGHSVRKTGCVRGQARVWPACLHQTG